MSKNEETARRLKRDCCDCENKGNALCDCVLQIEDLVQLLDAKDAEIAAARDAGLEEAAKVLDELVEDARNGDPAPIFQSVAWGIGAAHVRALKGGGNAV